MSEEDVIRRTGTPLTVASLSARLRECGLESGQTVLVHLAMSKLGWVVGGAEAVVLAMLGAVGKDGTIMMAAHSTGNTEPSTWNALPLPESWWRAFRANRPAFDPRRTPTSGMGVVPELFRTRPGAIRSDHPTYSFSARGPNAANLTGNHTLDAEMGDRAPLGKLYELDGHVLLLGVGHGNNTSLHLAESRADFPGKTFVPMGSAMRMNGKQEWITYEAQDFDTEDFERIGMVFDRAHGIDVRHINEAEVRFFRQRPLVDFAVERMERHRGVTTTARG